ncbi:hypothetical protein P5673_020349, partial [Acropora cervicornis]
SPSAPVSPIPLQDNFSTPVHEHQHRQLHYETSPAMSALSFFFNPLTSESAPTSPIALSHNSSDVSVEFSCNGSASAAALASSMPQEERDISVTVELVFVLSMHTAAKLSSKPFISQYLRLSNKDDKTEKLSDLETECASGDLVALMLAYKNAPTRNLKTQTLSLYAYRCQMKKLQKLHEPYESITT